MTNEWLSILRMPLFSFLSGYVYALRPVDGRFGEFTRGKVRRLILPLLLVGTGFAFLQTLAPGTHSSPIDWSMLHIMPVAHYWFLESLFLIFMLTALLERGGMLRSPARFAVVFACAAVLHMTAPVPVYFGMEGATYLLPFFLLGIATLRFREAFERPSVLYAAIATLAAIGIFHGSVEPISLEDPLAPQVLLSSVCLCVLMIRWRPAVGWLAWVGRYSFGIYLFHTIFGAAARMVAVRLGAETLPLLFAVGMTAGIGGSILLTATLRRVPIGHWFIGEKSRKRNVGGPARSEAASPVA